MNHQPEDSGEGMAVTLSAPGLEQQKKVFVCLMCCNRCCPIWTAHRIGCKAQSCTGRCWGTEAGRAEVAAPTGVMWQNTSSGP